MLDPIDNERFRKLLLSYPGKAIQFLYDAYYKSLLTTSERLTHNWKASEDILQETFTLVWENHEWLGQHHDKPIIMYLIRVVKNKSITFYNGSLRQKDNKTNYVNGAHLPSSDLSVEENIIERETIGRLRAVIATFPPREKECLLMSVDQDMTSLQIAAHLKLSRKAVQRSLTSAYKRLRKHWKGIN